MGALGLLARYPILPEARDWLRDEGPKLEVLLTDFLYGRARDRAKKRVWDALEAEPRKRKRFSIDDDEQGARSRNGANGHGPGGHANTHGNGHGPYDDDAEVMIDTSGVMLSEIDEEMELVSHPLARMLVAATGQDLLIRRFAVHEAKRLSKELEREPGETVAAVGRALDIPFQRREADEPAAQGPFTVSRADTEPGGHVAGARVFGLHFTDYLHHAPNEKNWRLPWRDLESGWVWLDKEDFVRLIEEVYKGYLEEELTGKENAVPGKLRETMGDEIVRLKQEAERRAAAYKQANFSEIDQERFPPCMRRILQDMHNHVNIPHMGRFAIVAFLNTLGMDAEDILKFFSSIPDFSADKSRYQIEHITGKGGPTEYTPPGCSTMQTYGVCPLDERDDICADIKHPLSHYRRSLWKKKQEARRNGGKTPTEANGPKTATGADEDDAGDAARPAAGTTVATTEGG